MAPAKVHCANRISVQQHEDFEGKELEKARTAGVIALADWPFEQLSQVIDGLKVWVEKLGPDGQVEKHPALFLIGSQTLNHTNAKTAKTLTPTTYQTTLTKLLGFCKTLTVRIDEKQCWGGKAIRQPPVAVATTLKSLSTRHIHLHLLQQSGIQQHNNFPDCSRCQTQIQLLCYTHMHWATLGGLCTDCDNFLILVQLCSRPQGAGICICCHTCNFLSGNSCIFPASAPPSPRWLSSCPLQSSVGWL